MAELLDPNFKDLESVFQNEFAQMTDQEITLDELLQTRKLLVKTINETLTADEKRFLISFKSRKPEWSLLGLENAETISQLPSVRWKLINLEKLSEKRHTAALKKLKEKLKID